MADAYKFSALYYRDFRLFWTGQVISLSGTWMQSVVQSWLVYSLTKSALYLGIVASLASLPILAFSLLGGHVADIYPKRNIIITTQILSIIPALLLGLLTEAGTVKFWHIALAALFLGTVNAFDVPARQAFMFDLVGRADITNAIALNSAAFNGARIVGPAIAGVIIASIGIPACFFINAISFVPVVAALFAVKARGISNDSRHGGMFKGIAEGWRFVAKEKDIFYILSLIAVFSLFGIPYAALLPVVAVETLGGGSDTYSALVAAGGAGSFIAAVTIAVKGEVKRKDIFMPATAVMFSSALVALAFSRNQYASMALVFIAGCGIVSFLATANSFIQQKVADSLRGRVMSLYTLVFLGLAPIGNSIIGLSAHYTGAVNSLGLFALVCLAGSAILMRLFKTQYNRSAK
ncbi:MAG: MFS transporter [Nitrospiraceae bacterium]|nr:MFS transporter [Nitrospiraceae bacterium]